MKCVISGDETNAVFEDADNSNVKIYFLTVPKCRGKKNTAEKKNRV